MSCSGIRLGDTMKLSKFSDPKAIRVDTEALPTNLRLMQKTVSDIDL